MTQIEKWLHSGSELFSEWLYAACHPVRQMEVLSGNLSPSTYFSRLLRLAVASYAINLVVYAPLLHIFGIEVPTNIGFIVSNLLALSLIFVLISVGVHVSLLVHGLKSQLVKTIALFNAPAITYFPLIAFLGMPASYTLFEALSEAKKQHLHFIPAVLYVFNYAAAHQEKNALLIACLIAFAVLSSILSALSLVLSTEALVQAYHNERIKAYVASTDGTVAGMFLGSATVVLFYFFVAYAFVSSS